MNKRFFSLLAAFALCLTLIPTTAFADDEKKEKMFPHAAVKRPARRTT